jgi:HD-GYP domain-containing protein (c-di-GMP phosphodiesterase class II)
MTTKDSYEIIQHNMKVSKLAEAFANYLGLSEEIAQMIAVAGVFIDIGKIAMDYKVFSKEKPLTEQEFEYIKQHASKSTEILIQSNLISRDILSCIVHHHESYNGDGYPTKVKGNAIPIGARVIKLCDVYYALTEERPYRKGYSHEEAINIMEKEREKYDPDLLNPFIEFINHKYKA